MPLKELRGIFPNLNADQQTITSDIDPNYNCVAWAIKDTLRWWEPFGLIIPASFPPYHWPDNLPHDLRPQTFIRLFETQGYQVTDDPSFERGFEKLALYIRENKFQHVARQLANGRWTSKIGDKEDIQHDLDDLISHNPFGYGEATVFLKRQTQNE